MRAILEHSEFDQALKGVFKTEVKQDTCSHDADDIAQTKLKHLVELDKETVWLRAIDKLHHEWSDQCRFKG